MIRTFYRSVIFLLGCIGWAAGTFAQDKPNILVLWGDDIGTWNISHNNRGMMGYMTPNIDRIARVISARLNSLFTLN